ncbi:somatostatin receptor type 5 isoform X2 [Nematostella vectensis]|uniref:somatostatin receptor type 5 isoform X2 n=1 Tax=Nematostella vectensis TaxID=45351 RepID=UPI002077225B|nr:somatostatin receptor type 5 isoform X2 [Nematostella vectensis]
MDFSWFLGRTAQQPGVMESGELILIILYALIATIGFLGNLFVCFIILQHRPVRRPMNWLFLNLAISDSTILVFLGFRHIITRAVSHPHGPTGDYLCKFLTGGNIAWVGAVSSMCSLMCIALERFFMVFKPTRYLSLFRVVIVKRVIGLSWLFGLLFNLPLFVVARFDEKISFCSETWPTSVASKVYATIWLAVVAVIPGIFMAVLYSQITYNLWIKKAQQTLPDSQGAISRARRKITKIVVTVSLIYCISWFPPLIDYVMMVFAPAQRHFGDTPHVAAVLMIVFNASVNPLVYTFQSETFRKQIKVSLFCLRAENTVNPLGEGEHLQTWVPPLRKGQGPLCPAPEERVNAMSRTGVDYMFLWLTGP